MKKKLIAVLLALTVVFSLFPATVLAANDGTPAVIRTGHFSRGTMALECLTKLELDGDFSDVDATKQPQTEQPASEKTTVELDEKDEAIVFLTNDRIVHMSPTVNVYPEDAEPDGGGANRATNMIGTYIIFNSITPPIIKLTLTPPVKPYIFQETTYKVTLTNPGEKESEPLMVTVRPYVDTTTTTATPDTATDAEQIVKTNEAGTAAVVALSNVPADYETEPKTTAYVYPENSIPAEGEGVAIGVEGEYSLVDGSKSAITLTFDPALTAPTTYKITLKNASTDESAPLTITVLPYKTPAPLVEGTNTAEVTAANSETITATVTLSNIADYRRLDTIAVAVTNPDGGEAAELSGEYNKDSGALTLTFPEIEDEAVEYEVTFEAREDGLAKSDPLAVTVNPYAEPSDIPDIVVTPQLEVTPTSITTADSNPSFTVTIIDGSFIEDAFDGDKPVVFVAGDTGLTLGTVSYLGEDTISIALTGKATDAGSLTISVAADAIVGYDESLMIEVTLITAQSSDATPGDVTPGDTGSDNAAPNDADSGKTNPGNTNTGNNNDSDTTIRPGGTSTDIPAANNSSTATTPSTSTTTPSTDATINSTEEISFSDVSVSDYFYNAVMWAAGNGITVGDGDSTTFNPHGYCTRAQIVTFLYRYAGEPDVTYIDSFSDVLADAYYTNAVIWAVANGITVGTGDGTTFSPDDPCTRAQAVTFLYRFMDTPTVSSTTKFSDVAADTYYADAVAWAGANGVTVGDGDGTIFLPDNDCTRAHIVTFLYRLDQLGQGICL